MTSAARRSRALALVLVLAVAAVTLSACSSPTLDLVATFDDVGDLQARHSVQMADVRVGEVSSIRLTDDFKAEVRLSVQPDVKIPEATVALLRTTSLLGEKFIELRPLGPDGEIGAEVTTAALRGPFLGDGDRIGRTAEAPELEFVAEEAIMVLGAVVADDLATLVDVGAEAFGGRGAELGAMIDDIASISATFASRTSEIQRIIEGLDRATATLATSSGELDRLFVNLAGTTALLAENRDRLVTVLSSLSALARSQNGVLTAYQRDIDRQIKQLDAIVAIAAGQAGEVATLITWLERFVLGAPKTIPGDFAQVYGWIVPVEQDPRSPHS